MKDSFEDFLSVLVYDEIYKKVETEI